MKLAHVAQRLRGAHRRWRVNSMFVTSMPMIDACAVTTAGDGNNSMARAAEQIDVT